MPAVRRTTADGEVCGLQSRCRSVRRNGWNNLERDHVVCLCDETDDLLVPRFDTFREPFGASTGQGHNSEDRGAKVPPRK
jgi:hypothetical protein